MKPFQKTLTCYALSASTLLLSGCFGDAKNNDNVLEVSTPQSEPTPLSPPDNKISMDSRAYSDEVTVHDSAQIASPQLMQSTMLSETRQKRGLHPTLVSSEDSENYASLTRNATVQTQTQAVSTFSIDVDTGAYSNVRRFLQNGQLPPSNAVRVEELLNYFSYDYPNATKLEEPFSVTTELGITPWNENTRLLHIGLKGYVPPKSEENSANLVFLIDVSGSMDSPSKLGLLKSSISLLTQELNANDTVSIVVYAGASGTVLEPTAGDQHQKINQALARLTAGGSTNGVQGIELAYQLAGNSFRENASNRVILATDGDFNVGISDVERLKQLISKKRSSGIALTTLGFGTGNYNDHLMEQLADVGNGSYAYIDTLSEARKVLVDEMQSTLLTIANDVKIQLEFNPAVVSEYRLIGYNNRVLANEEFNDDKVDAGEIGAGHTVTALYEIALQGEGGEKHTPSRYTPQTNNDLNAPPPTSDTFMQEIAELRLRYKLPAEADSQLSRRIIRLNPRSADKPIDNSDNFLFAASVAAFGQRLQSDTRIGSFSYQAARELARQSQGDDPFGYRAEYLRLLDMAASLERLERFGHLDNDRTPPEEG